MMGVLNVILDSFSDGGQHGEVEGAIRHALALIEQGAGIIDIGGQSTRPGAQPVPIANEHARVLPVVEALCDSSIPLSVDTFKPEVMSAVLEPGADIITDISGFRHLA